MKKFLSILLSVTMLMTILPATFAFADFSGEAMVLEAMVLEDGLEATKIEAGDTITVNINYAGGFAYTDSLTIELTYDTSYLTLVSGSAKATSKLSSGNINSSTAGKIIYSCFSGGNPIELEANEMVVTAQFTVNSSIIAKNVETTFDIEVTDCTCTDIADNNGKAEYPQLGGNGSFETLPVPCSFKDKTIIINPKSSDATLKTLKYGDQSIALVSGTYNYAVELPYGTTIPAVTCETNDEKASAAVTTENGVTTIVVTAEDGITKLTYTLAITVNPGSSDATLKTLKYGEESVTLVEGEYNYAVELPYGSEIPEVTYEVNDEKASATASTVDGVTTIEVTSENGVKLTYTLAITVNPGSSDATLKTLKYGEESITLVEGKYDYAVELPYGSTVPGVTYEVNDEKASATASTENGVTTIEVTSENGVKLTYTLAITVNPGSSDATLKTLKYGEDSVALEEGRYDYAVEVPYGTTVLPEVTYEANDEKASATASTVGGVTTIVVTSENGKVQTYTLTITVAGKPYTLDVIALGGTIKATYLNKENEDWAASKTAEFTIGTEIKLEAIPDAGATFLYWKDNESNRVVSYNTVYTVTMGTNKNVTAMFVEEDSYMVEFVGSNNKIYTSSQAHLDITVPEDPYLFGYTFKGWAIDGIKVDEYVAGYVIPAGTFTENTTIFAQQEVEETTYTVTIINAQEDLSGEYKYNDEIIVTPSEAMKETSQFKCWMRDGQIVSYAEEYKFFVGNYNTTVEAVFADKDAEVEAKPVISMAEPTIVAGNKISFMMERNVPENCSVVEAGILIKKGYIADGSENQITLDNHDYKSTSANTAKHGFYTIRKGNVKPYEWWSAVGYLIYKDANGETHTMYSSYVRGWIESIGDGGLEDGGDL